MSTIEKVLVIGGAGFIGSYTVRLLLKQGISVRVFDNLSHGSWENLPADHPNLETVQGDILDIKALISASDGISHYLHLAAQISVVQSINDPVSSALCNVQGFLHVLDAARHCHIKRVVYASSAAIYGSSTQYPLHEKIHPCPNSPYGLEKLTNEKYANLYSDLYGISTLGLRYFNVYGVRHSTMAPCSGVIEIFAHKFRDHQPIHIFGKGEQTRDFVSIDDVTQANLLALRGRLGSVCNVATGNSVSLLTLVKRLQQISGFTVPIIHDPPIIGDISDSSADTTLMRNALGINNPIDLDQGLAQLWGAVRIK